MKSKKNQGQVRIIEAFLASLVIFSALAVSSNYTTTYQFEHRNNLASIGFQTLQTLDFSGVLGECVDQRNWTRLREVVSFELPIGVAFNLTIYDGELRQVNDELVSNGFQSYREVVFVEYAFIGRNAIYQSFLIHLKLAVTA